MTKTHKRRQMNIQETVPDGYLPLQEIARQVSVSASTLARWARAGTVPVYRKGKIWYFDVEVIEHVTGQLVEFPDLQSLRDVAVATGIPASTLRRWANDGRIRAEKRGANWRVSLEDAHQVSETLTPGSPSAQ